MYSVFKCVAKLFEVNKHEAKKNCKSSNACLCGSGEVSSAGQRDGGSPGFLW